MKYKKIFTGMLVASVALNGGFAGIMPGGIPMNSGIIEAQAAEIMGTWDSNTTTVTLDSQGTLTISAKEGTTGRTSRYSEKDRAPWSGYLSEIKEVVINDGVTYVGEGVIVSPWNIQLYNGQQFGPIVSDNRNYTGNYITVHMYGKTEWNAQYDWPLIKRVNVYNDVTINSGTPKVSSDFGSKYNGSDLSIYKYGDYSINGSISTNITSYYVRNSATHPISNSRRAIVHYTDQCTVVDCSDATESCDVYIDTDTIKSILKGNNKEKYLSKDLSLDTLGDYALYNSHPLKSGDTITVNVTLDGTKSIGNYALSNMRDLNVAFNGSCENIGERAFSDINSGSIDLDNLNITGEVKDYAFSGNKLLTSVSLNANNYGKYVFRNCPNITDIKFRDDTTAIGIGALSGCSNVTDVKLPVNESFTTIPAEFCKGCSLLKTINIPASVTVIGDSAFNGCTSLPDVKLPDNLNSIGASAFENCSAIKNVNLGDRLETIGNRAFYGVPLSSVYIGESVSAIGNSVFGDKTKKSTIKELIYSSRNNIDLPQQNSFNCIDLETVEFKESVTHIPANILNGVQTINSLTVPNTITSVGENALKDQKLDFEKDELQNLTYVGNNGLRNTGYTISAQDTDAQSFGDGSFYGNNITELTISGNGTFNPKAFDALESLTIDSSIKNFDTDVSGLTTLKRINWLGTISSEMLPASLPSSARVFCKQYSDVHTWCENNDVAYAFLDETEIEGLEKGILPTLAADNKLFDCDDPFDVTFSIELGKKPAGADGIKKVMIDTQILPKASYEFDGETVLSVKQDYLRRLPNGTHSVSVQFDNATETFRSGASVTVVNSTVNEGNGGENETPPEALVTIKYEFYKDYPDFVVIPVKLNSASAITRLVIGTDEVDEQHYSLENGALVISREYLSTLDAAKYRVLPTFDDANATTISNIQLIVYDKAADRAAPYLLQSRVIFKGQDVDITFDEGRGELRTTNVLALVLDDKLILPNGDLKPFSSGNVNELRKAGSYAKDMEEASEDAVDETEIGNDITDKTSLAATPGEAEEIRSSNTFSEVANAGADVTVEMFSYGIKGHSKTKAASMYDAGQDYDEVFDVNGNIITISGEYIEGLNLEAGDHLIGAIFDNTEKTTDVKKVILTIEDKKQDINGGNTGSDKEEDKKDPGTEKDPSETEKDPSVPGDSITGETDPDKNNGTKPDTGTGSGNKPSGGNTGIISGGGSRPSNGSSGSSGSGSSGGGSGHSSRGSSSSGGYGPGSQANGPGSAANGSGSASAILSDGSMNAEFKPSVTETPGSWEGFGHDWQFKKADGTYAKGEWIGSQGDWYYIGADGKMKFDWFLDENGKWYMLNKDEGARFGAALYGWYFEKQDGKWYFMNPSDTAMLTGWQFINGKWYYLTEHNDAPTYVGDNANGWIYNGKSKPCGSMYVNEVTPDGYTVGSDGAWIK